tara:strand:- start:788 stop:3316 length:2529 start_codon:yes stop_codon:yes gene_type:complete
MNSHISFEEDLVLKKISHYLPAQSTLKDFVHHNSLHSFQDKEFFEGIFSASKIFGFQVTFNINEYRKLHKQGRIRLEIIEQVITRAKGSTLVEHYKEKMLEAPYSVKYSPRIGQLRANWKTKYKTDLDNLVQPLLFRILGSYLDQGIAIWHFPFEEKGLIHAIQILEESSFSSFFKSKRAKKLLFSQDLSIENLLKIIVGNPDFYSNYLFDQQYSHKGWSGIVAAIESNPDAIFYKKDVKFKDLILLELLLEIDNLDNTLGKNWAPLANGIKEKPIDYLSPVEFDETEEIIQLWQEAFEWDYYDEVLSGVGYLAKNPNKSEVASKSFQAMFCIDDRECSLRRHLESLDSKCETLGAPGFFGAAIYFQPFGGKFYDKNCPVALTPKHLIKEIEINQIRKHEIFHSKKTHTFIRGYVSTFTIGLLAGLKMTIDLARPKMQADISNAFSHMDVDGKLLIENTDPKAIENGLQIGYQVSEMSDIVESMLKGIDLTKNFSDIVYVVAHGSSSANNPHHGAHDCGACSGRPGAVNARVFAFMANHHTVRNRLASKGILIPDTTHFIGAMHDTASDEIAFYDEDILTELNLKSHVINKRTFENALDLNAKERARRFASINIKKDIKHIRHEIKKRSVSYFEPRPELGHGTNALCHVGTREKMKGLFLDRRAFLQSYNHRSDPNGDILKQVLGPLPVVCGGINLEYYFSRMDIEKMGAGTKLPHNVTGLIGVTNSSDGDIRTGLPLQMVENHDPVRLLMMIEHKPEVILDVIKASKEMFDWFYKGWIHLVAISPIDNNLYYFRKGQFELYTPLTKVIKTKDILQTIETYIEMESNHILDATKENIPVQVY